MGKCTVIILAGGEGTRMRQLGKFFPKPVMVAFDKPLLIRLINQLQEAGFNEIIVSTRHSFFAEITNLISKYYTESTIDQYSDPKQIVVIDNSDHLEGSLKALRKILEQVRTNSCLMCFSDIFFIENPFGAFLLKAPLNADYLGIAPAIDSRELTHGGMVYCEAENITSIVELPKPNPLIEGAARWSGLALFNTKEVADELDVFLSKVPQGVPEGDFFEFRREHGKIIQAIWVPDFINVNSPEHLLLTTLYAASENIHVQPELKDVIMKIASVLRRAMVEQYN